MFFFLLHFLYDIIKATKKIKGRKSLTDSENMIYNLVCDYYETRILMGACRYGELLPSISKIGESFQMAPRTVRAAFSRLEEKGYIRIESRKAAKVIYQVNDERINGKRCSVFRAKTGGNGGFLPFRQIAH